MKDYSHLKDHCFPDVDYSRSLQAKLNGRWVTVYNFILVRWTVADRTRQALSQWPEFAQVCAEYPQAEKFRITSTRSLLPYYNFR